MRRISQRNAGQRTQHSFGVVGCDAQAQAHVAKFDLEVQCCITGDDAAHQHIAAAAGVFGERMGADVHGQTALSTVTIGQQIKRLERQTSAPSVVQGAQDTALTTAAHHLGQIGKLHAHRAGCFEPHQTGAGRDLTGQVIRVHRIVKTVGDAKVPQFTSSQSLVRAVGVVWNQNFVAGFQHRQSHQSQRRQTTGHQYALQPTF